MSEYKTHCTPPSPECVFDLADGWSFEDEHGGAVIRCETHGLLAPGLVYEIDLPQFYTQDDQIVKGDDVRLKEKEA